MGRELLKPNPKEVTRDIAVPPSATPTYGRLELIQMKQNTPTGARKLSLSAGVSRLGRDAGTGPGGEPSAVPMDKGQRLSEKRSIFRRSWTRWDALILLSLGSLTIAHYAVDARHLWAHMVLFWLFQVPTLIGALTGGVRGGVATATLTSVLLFPHAIGLSQHHGLSANAIWMDLANLYVVGLAAGLLRDRWRKEQERGESMRYLRGLGTIMAALRRDLASATDQSSGLLVSLEAQANQAPALTPVVRALRQSLNPIEVLASHLGILRADPKLKLVRLDRVLAATEQHLQRCAPSRTIRIDWRCAPPVLPASLISLSTSLAVLVLHMAESSSAVQITVSKVRGWVALTLRPDEAGAPRRPVRLPVSSLEVAREVIRANGGRLDTESRSTAPHHPVRICIRSVLPIRDLSNHERRAASKPQRPSPSRNEGTANHTPPSPSRPMPVGDV